MIASWKDEKKEFIVVLWFSFSLVIAKPSSIEKNIIDSYDLLDNPDDQELFYDYLIANTKLYWALF